MDHPIPKLLFLFALSFLQSPFCIAQNLVPNPSFEAHDTCPCGPDQIILAIPWYSADVYASVDYYNACNPDPLGDGVPNNKYGHQKPFTLNQFINKRAYAAIWPYSDYNPYSDRSYIGVELTDSLKRGRTYCIGFYVNLADSATYAVRENAICAYISKEIVRKTGDSLRGPFRSFIPQIKSNGNNFLADTANWVSISDYYIASGGEQYITIGNFFDNAHTDILYTGRGLSYCFGAYYYIDSVTVILCDSANSLNEISGENNNVNIYPNPASDKITINIPQLYQSAGIIIYDLPGKEIITTPLKPPENQIDLTNLPPGVYFIRINFDNKSVIRKIVKI